MKFLRTISCLFFSFFITAYLGAAAPAAQEEFPLRRPAFRPPPDFYVFLGLGTSDQLFKKAFQFATQTVQQEEKVTPFASPEAREARRTELFNEYYKREITRACKAKREAIQRDMERATEAVKQAQELEKETKLYDLLKLQYDFYITTNFCPTLLDPDQREAYDKLIQAAAEQTGAYFAAVKQGIDQALMLSPDRYVVLNQIIGEVLSDLIKDVPGPAVTLFNQQMALRNISAISMPYGPDVRYGIGFTGLMSFNKLEVRVTVYIIQDIYGDKRASMSVELPEHYKLSDLFPAITILDTFSLPRTKLVLSNFEGIDIEGFRFKKGLNYVAIVETKGPLAALNALKAQSKYLKALVFEGTPILLTGLINPFDFSKTSFGMVVPFYMGIDLQQLPYMPSIISNVINKITTDDLRLTILPFRKDAPAQLITLPRFRITAETGTRIVLGTQKDPLRLTLNGLVEPPSVNHKTGYFSMGGNVKNMLELGWLAIGNASIQVDFDPALMAALAHMGYPLPFTGLLVSGQVDLGKPGDARAQLAVAGGFRKMTQDIEKKLVEEVKSANAFSSSLGDTFVKVVAQERKKIAAQLPEVLFDVTAQNIRFADLLSYTTKLAAKAGVIKQQIPVAAFPSMTLHKVWGHLALVDTRIADKEYKAGLGLQVETEFWQKKAGFRVHILAPEQDGKISYRLSGWGYMPAINLKLQGKDVFRLHGLSEDKGPRLAFLFNPQEPQKGRFEVDGALVVPALGLKQLVHFKWYYWWLIADFESKFAGFSVVFGVRMNTKAQPPLAELQVPVDIKEGKQEEDEEPFRLMKPDEAARYAEFEKWRQLYIKFGFKDDFAEFLNGQLVPALRSIKTKSLAQLDRISAFIAEQQVRGTAAMDQEIAKTDQEIAALKQNIANLKAACSQRSVIAQISCRAAIAAQQAKLQGKNFYRTALLRPTKAVVRGTTEMAKRLAQARAWRMATEAILEGASKGIELIAGGIQLLRIREAVGEYSYRDIVERKLPRLVRLVVEFNLGEEPLRFVLEDLQFDFRTPKQSGALIAFEIMQAYMRGKNAKYAQYIPQLMMAS